MPASGEKEDRMWALADKLARSGDYTGWWMIEVELRSRGFPRGRQLLDSKTVRERLDQLCAEAQKGQANA